MTEYIVLSAILFTIGSVGVLVRRNALVVFMCVELMLNASNLALVAFAKQNGNLEGQVAAFFVMVVAAAEVVVGLEERQQHLGRAGAQRDDQRSGAGLAAERDVRRDRGRAAYLRSGEEMAGEIARAGAQLGQ